MLTVKWVDDTFEFAHFNIAFIYRIDASYDQFRWYFNERHNKFDKIASTVLNKAVFSLAWYCSYAYYKKNHKLYHVKNIMWETPLCSDPLIDSYLRSLFVNPFHFFFLPPLLRTISIDINENKKKISTNVTHLIILSYAYFTPRILNLFLVQIVMVEY